MWFDIGFEVDWKFQGWEFRDDGGSRCFAYGLDSQGEVPGSVA